MSPNLSTQSGIAVSDSGERHIPSSKRADGTVRREIKVRPGYKPPEDVEVYRNRTAEAWKGRKSGAVPGAEALGSATTGTSTASKNAKRREARKRAAAAVLGEGEAQESNISDQRSTDDVKGVKDDCAEQRSNNAIEADSLCCPEGVNTVRESGAEKTYEKDARKLAKKLRQAKELKDRKEKGDALLPEQLEKVIRINEITRQLEGLGFDANGDKKNDT